MDTQTKTVLILISFSRQENTATIWAVDHFQA
jgi:hypothetical protein